MVARVVRAHHRHAARSHQLRRITHDRRLVFEVHRDARLVEARERAHAHAGITVYFENQTPIVGDAAKLVAAGSVPVMSADNACNHHH